MQQVRELPAVLGKRDPGVIKRGCPDIGIDRGISDTASLNTVTGTHSSYCEMYFITPTLDRLKRRETHSASLQTTSS